MNFNESIFVGYSLNNGGDIYLTNKMRSGHVQILGATGRGKTASVVVPWFIRDLKRRNIPILIDGKGDESILDDLKKKIPAPIFKELQIFNLSDPKSTTLNPLSLGSAQEIADRLITSFEFESEYFKALQHSWTLMVLECLEVCSAKPTLGQLYDLLANPNGILDLIKSKKDFPDPLRLEALRFCQLQKESREEKMSGLLSQLRPFASGHMRTITSQNDLDLKSLVQGGSGKRGAIILLNTLKYQKSAKVFGKMLMQLLAWVSTNRSGGHFKQFVPVFIDEFSAFVFEGFEQFLNKARSSGIGLHLSHQSLGDLESVSSHFAKTVNVNTNVKVLLGLNDPDTADYMARHLGTRSKVKATERASKDSWGDIEESGEMSLRDTESYKIHPNKLKNYSNGQGVLSLLVDGFPFTEEVQFDPDC